VRGALEAELPWLRPAVVRARFHFRETGAPAALVDTLDEIRRRGSQGVVLKAPDVPEVAAATLALTRAGIPVVTLVTDLPTSGRAAYVGIDNRSAGATAAYLVGQWLGAAPGDVLVTLSSGSFRGEEEREMGFRAALRGARPARELVEITESDGLDERVGALVRDALRRHPGIRAVYSIGAATWPPWRPSPRSAGSSRCTSRTTWTVTTPACCAPDGCPPCCTTTWARTCAGSAR
jgi:LacI family transcriptional regulator